MWMRADAEEGEEGFQLLSAVCLEAAMEGRADREDMIITLRWTQIQQERSIYSDSALAVRSVHGGQATPPLNTSPSGLQGQ